MREFKITAVLHSGENGRRRRPVRSKADTDMLGRYIYFDADGIKVGEPFNAVMDYENSMEPFRSGRPVVARRYIKNKMEEYLEVETEDRIYKLAVT